MTQTNAPKWMKTSVTEKIAAKRLIVWAAEHIAKSHSKGRAIPRQCNGNFIKREVLEPQELQSV